MTVSISFKWCHTFDLITNWSIYANRRTHKDFSWKWQTLTNMISNLLLGQEIVMIYWDWNYILATGGAAKTAAQSAVKNCTGIGFGTSWSYNVPTNFRLELLEPSAREVEVQQFFLALMLFRVSLGLSHVLLTRLLRPLLSTRVQKINTSLAGDSIRSRRKLVDTL